MLQISNEHGVVSTERGTVYGWRGDQLIGSFPMPLSDAEVDLVFEMCLHRNPGDGTYDRNSSVTEYIFRKYLTAPVLGRFLERK